MMFYGVNYYEKIERLLMSLRNKQINLVALVICIFCPFMAIAEDDVNIFSVELRSVDGLKVYNQQVQLQIESQISSIERLKQTAKESKSMARELLPLMVKMTDALGIFIRADLPFNGEERLSSFLKFKSSISGAGSVLSDQYRQLFSLYQIESEYGRSYEAYTGSIVSDDGVLVVDYLRVGRLGFYYQTKDGKVSAMWDKSSSGWVILPEELNRHIRKGIRVASKTIAPELINLPLITSEIL
jgi:hypothetical protein